MKILYINECERCNHCMYGCLGNDAKKELYYFCDKEKKRISDINLIPEWCNLKGADKYAIIDHLIRLRDNWYACEKKSDEVIWGECAYEIDTLIEKAAGEK